MAQEFRLEDFASFLISLSDEGCGYFLEGGQAVNFWAEFFNDSEFATPGFLSEFRPFTSKDCDIWISADGIKTIEEKFKGELVRGQSPADGQIAIFTLSREPRLVVDLLSMVYGLPPEKSRHHFERSLDFQGIRVLDPFLLFKSKCHCLCGLDQTKRQDEKHVRMLLQILPSYFLLLRDRAISGEIKERQVVKEMKLLLKICSTEKVSRVLQKLDTKSVNLFPLPEFISCELEVVKQFSRKIAES